MGFFRSKHNEYVQNKTWRVAALVLVLCIFFISVLPSLNLLVHAFHSCHDGNTTYSGYTHECAVCFNLSGVTQTAINTVKTLAFVFTVVLSLVALYCLKLAHVVKADVTVVGYPALAQLKVRLNN